MSNASETANIPQGALNEAPVQIDHIINHPLFSTVLGTHLFQHTNLAPPGQNDAEQQGEQILDEDSKEKHDAEQVRLMRMIAQRKENERRNIDNLLTDPNSLVNVVAEQYYANQKFGKKQSPFNGMEEEYNADVPEPITEFLIKQSALHILQKVELDMMHTALDEYIENMHSALQITPTDAESLKQQQQMLMNSSREGAESPTLDPRTIQQIQQHHAATGSLPQSSDHFNDPIASFPGPPIPAATFAGKKQEEVITELKRKYSGQVLQVAQSKKKKKNFQKDTSELLNNWFFSNLHDPYPSDEVKKQLAAQTNLTLSQVNNWFGNKRIRYKRKMLEKSRRVAAGQGVDASPGEIQTPTSRSRKRRSTRADSADSSDGTPVTPQHMYQQQQGGNHYYSVPPMGSPRIPPPMNSIFVSPQQQMTVDAYQQQQMRGQQHQMGYQYYNE